ncbi:hypothetical protein MNBD_GAMMA09-1968 [hydrothermal vent metagenome]|uniref:TRAP transporter TatT component family protein n=1 Tax=hydrothermal vent metagenome TaxID=652676 RepID=A0A3B0Y0U6_9ZZZZ
MKKKSYLFTGIILIFSYFLSSCSFYIDSFTNNLNQAIQSSNDPQTVMQALPAYLVLLDGLIEGDPQDEDMLMASVSLMNAYSSLLGSQADLIEDIPDYKLESIINQQKILNDKALHRAEYAMCIHKDSLCNLTKDKFKELEIKLSIIEKNDIDILYRLGTAWVSWIQVNTDDWNAMAQIAQIKLIMETVINNNEMIDNGNAHVYLGVLNSLIPASLGGKPKLGREYFEAALRISEDKNLMAKALYAEYYARLMFDEKLHKRLISEILSIDESNNHLNLINTLAVEKAKALRRSSSDYF